jgi:hypothetical protein
VKPGIVLEKNLQSLLRPQSGACNQISKFALPQHVRSPQHFADAEIGIAFAPRPHLGGQTRPAIKKLSNLA